MTLEEELRCEGHFGFGGGYVWGKKYGLKLPQGEDRDLYCSSLCGRRELCWYRHRGRVMFLFPLATAEFMALFYDADNPHLTVEEWRKRQTPGKSGAALARWAATHDVMAGNLEDGLAVALDRKPRDRGPFTLPWPFPDPRRLYQTKE